MTIIYVLIVPLFFGLTVVVFFQHPQFGSLPKGERLQRIKKSPNFRQGQFQNLHHTPPFAEDSGYLQVLRNFFLKKSKRKRPKTTIPSKKTNLLELDAEENILVWFGHSSYFLQLDGKNFLIDPVFSDSASPLPFGTRAFKGTNNYSAADMPHIDYLLLTHDHWDHLDYKTIKALKPKIKQVICGLGTGAHLETWGYISDLIMEKDWNEKVDLDDGFVLYTVPARHFSGRTLKRNTSLWTSFILKSPSLQIFIGGDSGYDTHFFKIGKDFGPFDLAILENGQYNQDWKYIHLLPEQVLQAAKDLRAKKLLPVHHSKFSLALHAWDEPLIKLSNSHSERDPALAHPMIGEKFKLEEDQLFKKWWEPVL